MGQRLRVGWAGAAVAAALGSAGCWTQSSGDPQSSGHNPFEAEVTPETVADLEVAWTAPVPSDDPEWRSPTVVSVSGVVHTATPDEVVSIDLATGEERWTAPLPGAPVRERTAIATGPDDVLVATFDGPEGSLHRFDAATGDLVGTTPIGGTDADGTSMAPTWLVRSGDLVVTSAGYVGPSGDEYVLTVTDLADPDDSWTRRVSADGANAFASNPVILHGLVYVATMEYDTDGNLLEPPRIEGFDPSTPCPAPSCEPFVEAELPSGITMAISGSPDGDALAVHGMEQIVVLDVDTLEPTWVGALPGNDFDPRYTPTWTPDGVAVVRSDAETGTTLSTFDLVPCGEAACPTTWSSVRFGGFPAGPATSAGGLLWVSTLDEVVALPAACSDGCEPLVTLDGAQTQTVVTSGTVLVGTWDGVAAYGVPG